MARAMVDVQKIVSTGLINPSVTTIPADGVEFKNTGNEIIYINAPSAADITIITDATVADGLEINDRTISLSAGDEMYITGLDKRYYNNTDGTVYINSTVTDTEVAIFTK